MNPSLPKNRSYFNSISFQFDMNKKFTNREALLFAAEILLDIADEADWVTHSRVKKASDKKRRSPRGPRLKQL